MRDIWLLKYIPTEYKKSIYNIDYNSLYKLGYKNLLFDLDNTLADYDTSHSSTELINLFDSIKKIGFNIIILTNNKKKRLSIFKDELNVVAYNSLKKPFTKKFLNYIKEDSIDLEKSLIIGDQVYTDIRFASNLSINSILVDPLNIKSEKWYTKLHRIVEKFIMKKVSLRFTNKYIELGLNDRYGRNKVL